MSNGNVIVAGIFIDTTHNKTHYSVQLVGSFRYYYAHRIVNLVKMDSLLLLNFLMISWQINIFFENKFMTTMSLTTHT